MFHERLYTDQGRLLVSHSHRLLFAFFVSQRVFVFKQFLFQLRMFLWFTDLLEGMLNYRPKNSNHKAAGICASNNKLT